MPKIYKVAIIVPDGAQILDICGPVSVLDCLNRNTPSGVGYKTSLIGLQGNLTKTNGTIRLEADSTIDDFDFSEITTLIVPGGEPGIWRAMKDDRLLSLIRDFDLSKRRVVSICTGSFILAAAGILNGRTCTTHWDRVESMRTMFPEINLTPEKVYTRCGHIWTSAGVSTGIDTALALVKDDFGREASLRVARDLVLHTVRSISDIQKSKLLEYTLDERNKLWDLFARIYNSPAEDYKLERMSSLVNMSRRSLTRHFIREFGTSPATVVRQARVEKARRLLENKAMRLDEVAKQSGFSSPDVMRRVISSTQNTASDFAIHKNPNVNFIK